MPIRNTKSQQMIINLVVKLPGRTSKQIAALAHCSVDAVWRLIRAGEIIPIKRRLYHPTEQFTAVQVKTMFPTRKVAAERRRLEVTNLLAETRLARPSNYGKGATPY